MGAESSEHHQEDSFSAARPAVAAVADDTGRPHQGDPRLVAACLAGDQVAWSELVERYSRLVYSIPRRMGMSAADADDVFQKVFTTLYRRLGDVRDQTRLSAWLIVATQRECWRVGKRAGATATTELDEMLADGAPPPADEITRMERDQLVREGLRRLDDRCRELLTALFLEPASPAYEAIAARLGMSVGSIGPTRARCFRKMEATLRSLGIEDAE